MIKNERQYNITKARADRFTTALEDFQRRAGVDQETHPLLLNMQEDALKSQLADLKDELLEYEAVKAGDFPADELMTVAGIPLALIRTRISNGLSQKDLAERLGLKEQQIQRYEATEYASASLARIKQIVGALGVAIDNSLLDENVGVTLSQIVRSVSSVGLDQDFVLKRLVPRRMVAADRSGDTQLSGSTLIHAAADAIGRIFDWTTAQIMSGEALQLKPLLGTARFKTYANADTKLESAYAVYARHLSLLVTDTCSDLPKKNIPMDPQKFSDDVVAGYGSISLGSVVRHMWDLGVPVLGLDDHAAFHGACFREQGRNVLVIKQQTSSESRWTFDLLHEIWHAAQEPDKAERTVLEAEEMSEERRNSEEETIASKFAGAVLLGGRGHELAELCLSQAKHNLRRLKSVVERVAVQEDVPVDALAYYLAFRLYSEQGEDWWGPATNLQVVGNPWEIVRDIFFEHVNFSRLADPDREILAQALTPWEEVANV